MWNWTFKSLVRSPLTLTMSVAAAACAMLLAILFEAIYAGEAKQVVAYLENADADVWVMQDGVSNMHMATSYLSDWKAREVRDVDGVASVESILYLNTVIDAGGKKWFSFIVGLDSASKGAGPWSMAAGRSMPGPGEAIVPEVFADMTGLRLGDAVAITDRKFRVSGFSADTFSMGNTVIFVTKNDLEDVMSSLDIVSFMLVRAEPEVSPDVLARRIVHDVAKVNALPSSAFVENDRTMVMQMGVETIALMTMIGGSLAILLVAFTVYSQIARQQRELAIAKALGATNRMLLMSVIAQATAISLVSVLAAVLLALILVPLTDTLVPQVTLRVTGSAIERIAILGVTVAVVASVVPAQRIARADPVTAFHT
jgi:ABC-type antimicrobial peptide transport system permease subunit